MNVEQKAVNGALWNHRTFVMVKSVLRSFLGVVLSVAFLPGAHAQNPEGGLDNRFRVDDVYMDSEPNSAARFETSAALLFLRPNSGNLVYATDISPLPPLTPHWNNQAVSPEFSPAFNVGMRYVVDAVGDVQLSWTHMNTYDSASVTVPSPQALGPSYLIGPPPPYSSASAIAHFAYDAVNLDGGIFLNAGNRVQVRPFVGLQGARISQRLTTKFLSSDGTIHFTDDSHSLFTGTGPRLGMDMHCTAGRFDFLGGIAGALLIGTMQSRIDFFTTSPMASSAGLIPNSQFLTSADATVVIPSIDAKLGTSYTLPVGRFGSLKCEAGYQAAVYMDAVNQYSLSEVSGPETIPFEGTAAVFLRTAAEYQSNFLVHGPYVKLLLEF